MKKNEKIIPDDHSVMRWVKTRMLKRETGTNKPVGVFHDFFKLRKDIREDSLSANWLEFFDGTQDEQIKACLDDFRKSLNSPPNPPVFSILPVGTIKSICAEYEGSVRVLHEPSKSRSHAAIKHIPEDEAELLNRLCDIAKTTLFSSKHFEKVIPSIEVKDFAEAADKADS